MTATTIPTFIILLLAFALGAVVGSLWGLSQHRHIYDWLSASLISRMQQTLAPYGGKLTDEEQQAIDAAKGVLARQYTGLALADCQHDSGLEAEFFSETLQADIIEYHRRADAWPTEQEKN